MKIKKDMFLRNRFTFAGNTLNKSKPDVQIPVRFVSLGCVCGPVVGCLYRQHRPRITSINRRHISLAVPEIAALSVIYSGRCKFALPIETSKLELKSALKLQIFQSVLTPSLFSVESGEKQLHLSGVKMKPEMLREQKLWKTARQNRGIMR